VAQLPRSSRRPIVESPDRPILTRTKRGFPKCATHQSLAKSDPGANASLAAPKVDRFRATSFVVFKFSKIALRFTYGLRIMPILKSKHSWAAAARRVARNAAVREWWLAVVQDPSTPSHQRLFYASYGGGNPHPCSACFRPS
jgi:hypothetical protein